jgi:putative transposase
MWQDGYTGKLTQNAYIECFNRTARHEWLELYLFETVEQTQLLATQWLWTYNNERPPDVTLKGKK